MKSVLPKVTNIERGRDLNPGIVTSESPLMGTIFQPTHQLSARALPNTPGLSLWLHPAPRLP